MKYGLINKIKAKLFFKLRLLIFKTLMKNLLLEEFEIET